MEKKCLVCDKPFNAKRETAKFCSPTCRVKYSRQVNEDPTPAIETPHIEDTGWFNSAENKTQEEIENHYTLANFPCRQRYHSSGGGGTGSLSPYKMSDPRYKAYSVN
jgi:hypothetical protein